MPGGGLEYARLAEQTGRGGSFFKELRMFASHVSKPSVSTLLDREGRSPNSDSEKLQRWAEHFSGVVNCGVEINEATLETLPVVEVYPTDTELDVPNDDELCAPLTEEEIHVAISHLKNGRAPGLDEISAEMLKLGGNESVQWLKLLSDCIWRGEPFSMIGSRSCLSHSITGEAELIVINNEALPS